MEIKDNFLKLQVNTLDVLKTLLISSIGIVGIVAIINYLIYLIYESFKTNSLVSFFLIFKAITIWNLIPALVFLGFAIWVACLFFFQGLRDIIFLVKYHGVFFYMDNKEIRFYNFDTKESKIKTWAEFEDVGCYKQESKTLLYQFQIKFTDGDTYTFDLRGTIPTEEFKDKVEEFYLRYSE